MRFLSGIVARRTSRTEYDVDPVVARLESIHWKRARCAIDVHPVPPRNAVGRGMKWRVVIP